MRITQKVIMQLLLHAKKDAPLEACGYLAGQNGIISAAYELTNADKSSEHFSFDPREQFSVLRNARAKGLEICAVYHSHPVTPARPSDEDLKLSIDPEMFYLIVSLCGGKEEVKAFKIKERIAQALDIEVINGV